MAPWEFPERPGNALRVPGFFRANAHSVLWWWTIIFFTRESLALFTGPIHTHVQEKKREFPRKPAQRADA